MRKLEYRVSDYFIICDGNSNTQVNAIISSVTKKVSKGLRDKPWGVEGTENAEWVLLDYVCLLYTSPSPRDKRQSRMPSSA